MRQLSFIYYVYMLYISGFVVYTMSFRLNITIYASISNTTLNDASTTEYKEIKTGVC